MSLPTYGEYKGSGASWLGPVPTHWAVVQSRRYFVNRNEKAVAGDKQLTASQKHGVVYQADFMELEGQKVMQVIIGADILKHAEPNDFVISMRSFQGGIEWCGLRGSISSAYVMLVPSGAIWSPFYRYLFKSAPYIQALQATTNLVRDGQALRFSNFTQVLLPLFPVEEQQGIAAFLDRETAKIDALIAEQEKLIALLTEKRQATISHAVTKGLNPKAPMKESGVAWLGEVPEHWTACPLKMITRIGNGSTPNRDNPDYWADEGFPWLNSSVVNQEEVSEAERFVTALALKECHLPIVEPPAVLVGITGQGKTRGMATRLAFAATLNQHLAYIKPFEGRLTEHYLLRGLEAAYPHLRTESEGAGSTKGAITCEQLGNLRIPVPPLTEQLAIASFLEEETAKLDKLKSDSERGITLLKERRSALIAAAVTGQIDVRGLVLAEKP